MNSVICRSFLIEKPLWSYLCFCTCKMQDKSQEGGMRFNEKPSNALSRSQRLNSEEQYSSKISRTKTNGRSIISGFQKCFSSHLWACSSVTYSKTWLTRASKGVFHLRKMVTHHFQQMNLMLLGNISTFKFQQVKPSKRAENMTARLQRFTSYKLV